jgi:esterase/lipase superfamily enzyme
MLFTVDSVDEQSWSNETIPPVERLKRHMDYERYILNEVVPFVRRHCNAPEEKPFLMGASMGGYHAVNFFFRRPDVFEGLLALSAMFQVRHFLGDYMDDQVYFHSPLHYLGNMSDDTYLEQYRKGRIIICVGRGQWDTPMLADAYALKNILDTRDVPAWFDVWGYDADHDWVWWRKQLPYFLNHICDNLEESPT